MTRAEKPTGELGHTEVMFSQPTDGDFCSSFVVWGYLILILALNLRLLEVFHPPEFWYIIFKQPQTTGPVEKQGKSLQNNEENPYRGYS